MMILSDSIPQGHTKKSLVLYQNPLVLSPKNCLQTLPKIAESTFSDALLRTYFQNFAADAAMVLRTAAAQGNTPLFARCVSCVRFMFHLEMN